MNETTPSLFGITLQNKLTKLWDLELKEREIRQARTTITMEIRLAMANDLGLHVDQVSVRGGCIIINPSRHINHAKVERLKAKVQKVDPFKEWNAAIDGGGIDP